MSDAPVEIKCRVVRRRLLGVGRAGADGTRRGIDPGAGAQRGGRGRLRRQRAGLARRADGGWARAAWSAGPFRSPPSPERAPRPSTIWKRCSARFANNGAASRGPRRGGRRRRHDRRRRLRRRRLPPRRRGRARTDDLAGPGRRRDRRKDRREPSGREEDLVGASTSRSRCWRTSPRSRRCPRRSCAAGTRRGRQARAARRDSPLLQELVLFFRPIGVARPALGRRQDKEAAAARTARDANPAVITTTSSQSVLLRGPRIGYGGSEL